MNTGKEFHCITIKGLTVVLWLTSLATAFSQDYIFDTEIINVEDGLPHRMTYYIVQDKEDFVWVSTQGAISRYDGYNFKTYNASFLHIPETGATRLAIDKNNRLWYCETNSDTPVSGVINIAKDSLYSMESISKGLFTSKDVAYLGSISADSDEIIVFTRSGIIYKYNGNFEEIFRLPYPVSSKTVFCKAAPDGSYWITHDRDLFRVKDNKILQTINADKRIGRIIATAPELIVKMVSLFHVVTLHKLQKDTLVPFTIAPHPPKDIERPLQFHKDYTCYATKDGLMIQDTTGKLIYRFDDLDGGTHTRKLIPITILVDRQDILWVTTQNGLLKLTAKKNPFEIILPNNGMRGIFKDRETLWVGGGLILEAPGHIKTEQEYLYARGNDAMSFYKDLRGHLWIGTSLRKVVEYVPAKDTYIHYDFDLKEHTFHLPFQNPLTQNYWIGTNNGLFRLDITTKKATPFPLPIPSDEVNIRQAYQNKQGIWLAGSKGIFLMDAKKETIIKHYTTADGLPTNSIIHIHEDDEGIFWLGTQDAGLVRWNRQNNSFRQYSREDELSNNKIYAVYEDDDETLWLPSDYGLMAFDKNTETTRVYLPKDGIAHEEFNYFSHFQDTDGTLYFGGLNGITKFHPAALREDSHMEMPLYATRVRVLEKDGETFMDKTAAFKAAKKIVLSPNDRILEVELTLLDYERSGENQYAYKLSGKQEQWIYTRENRLSIINPHYGKYKLEIKARGASGQWSAAPLVIPMHVKMPFYMQWWFILASVLIIAVMVVIAVRWRVRKLEKDRSRLEAEVQKRIRQIEKDKEIIEEDKRIIEKQAEDLKVLDKAKTRFFSNMTHEFRTPLTLLIGPVEQLANNTSFPFRRKLRNVLKNAYSLLDLINQLLDISKLESSKMKLEISHGDIIHYTRGIISRFRLLTKKKKLSLIFKPGPAKWETHFDRDKWDKIIVNLLSNAIKFTPEGGRINIILEQSKSSGEDSINLEISDTGEGIDAVHINHVFDRFYQVDDSATRVQGGTGIGLSLIKELLTFQGGSISVASEADEGTTFKVKLPVLKPLNLEDVSTLPSEEPLPMPVIDELWLEEREFFARDGANKKKLKVLIIEDSLEMIDYICSCIDGSMYEMFEALDGEEGIAKAQEIVPDLIISDIMMPKKDGFEVTRAIRNNLATSHIPLILLTAKASLESRLKGFSRGADAYLTKPFSPQELNIRIRKLIALRRLLQQRYSQQELPETSPEFEKEDAFITQLKVYITAHIADPNLDGNSISKHFGMSRMQLYRKLSTLTDHTLREYIRSIRLETAKNLIEEGELNIAEIAYDTGFSSPAHFSRTFKRFYGKSPSDLK